MTTRQGPPRGTVNNPYGNNQYGDYSSSKYPVGSGTGERARLAQDAKRADDRVKQALFDANPKKTLAGFPVALAAAAVQKVRKPEISMIDTVRNTNAVLLDIVGGAVGSKEVTRAVEAREAADKALKEYAKLD